MKKSTVVVTGGCGYIGSHTLIQLANEGYDVISIDNYSRSSPLNIDNIHRVLGSNLIINHNIDLSSRSDVFKLFRTFSKPFSVIHFAALKSVPESVTNPSIYYCNNISSLLNTLDASLAFGAKDFVFSSSCSVYGDIKDLPVAESTPLSKPQSPYAFTKVIGESIMNDYFDAFGLNSICLRYFNPVGAHPSGLIGETPFGTPNNLVPVLTQTLIGLRDSMEVYGGSLPTRDGSCIRDYVHVLDIANAHVSALKYLDRQTHCHEIINLGSGTGTSVFEAISMLESITNLKLNYTVAQPREGDVIEIYSNCQKARSLLNWAPTYSLEDMISSAWKWELELAKRNSAE
jgi:UDP-glucose 4-epimerase